MLQKYRCDPTDRQNAEAILIRNAPSHLLMNSKQEHIQPCDVKEKYETSRGNWEDKKQEKLTKIAKEKLRSKIKEHLSFTSSQAVFAAKNYEKK